MSTSATNNYLRVGTRYIYFDDTNELETRRAFKRAAELGAPCVAFRIPTVGWFTYMNGTRLIMPCPDGWHDYRLGVCVRCGLLEKESTDED